MRDSRDSCCPEGASRLGAAILAIMIFQLFLLRSVTFDARGGPAPAAAPLPISLIELVLCFIHSSLVSCTTLIIRL